LLQLLAPFAQVADRARARPGGQIRVSTLSREVRGTIARQPPLP
jgi:hypothetical protein